MNRAQRRAMGAGGVKLVDDVTLPKVLRNPTAIAYIGALLAYREGDVAPPIPAGYTHDDVAAWLKLTADPNVRRAVVRWLSKLLPPKKATSQ